MTTTDEQASAHLSFTFVGDWSQIRIADEQHTHADIDAVVRATIPATDEYAPLRALSSERFRAAAVEARRGGALSMFMSGEIAKGVPLPALMTVFAPHELVMTPAVGTDPKAVLDAFRSARAHLGAADEPWVEFDIPNARVGRTSRVTAIDVNEASDEPVDAPMLMLDYWLTVPGTKRLIAIAIQTPVVHVREIATQYFDATVAGFRYEQ